MENITEIEIDSVDGTLRKHIIIDRGNGEFTSMPKETWDEIQARQEAQSL